MEAGRPGKNYCSLSAERSDVMTLETHFGYRTGRSDVVGKEDSMYDSHVSGLRNCLNSGAINRDMETASREVLELEGGNPDLGMSIRHPSGSSRQLEK